MARHSFTKPSITTTKPAYRMWKRHKQWLFGASLITSVVFGLSAVPVHADTESVPPLPVATTATEPADKGASPVEEPVEELKSSTTTGEVTPDSGPAATEPVTNTPSVNAPGAPETTAPEADDQPVANALKLEGMPAKIGYGSGIDKVKLTLKGTVEAGQTVKIRVPNSVFFGTVDPEGQVGQTDVKIEQNKADGSQLVTIHFNGPNNYIQSFNIPLKSNAYATPTPVEFGGTSDSAIIWQIDGGELHLLKFTQVMQPSFDITTVTRQFPSDGTTPLPNETIKTVLPNVDYAYRLKMNEANGVFDDDRRSALLNSGVNYTETTITVPTPPHFVLNEAKTRDLNHFDAANAGTTITQSGDAIIITVPAGAGSQGYQGGLGYAIVGSFNVDQTASDQVLTATGQVTVDQVINANGDKVHGESQSPWTETIAAAGQVGGNVSVSALGNRDSSADTDNLPYLVQDKDQTNDPLILNHFSFANHTAMALTDLTATITVPTGLVATGFKVPQAMVDQYLHETTSWTYVATLTDGTEQTGTIEGDALGKPVMMPQGQSIAKLTLRPNTVAPGGYVASTGTLNGNDGPTKQNDQRNDITLYGHLDQSVIVGTKLETAIDLSSSAGSDHATSTQIVVGTQAERATVTFYIYTSEKLRAPGGEGGFLYTAGGNTHATDTTDKIFEPIYYYVLPKGTRYREGSFDAWDMAKPAPTPKIDATQILDDGRQVVAIDYTGTGALVPVNKPTGKIYFDILPTAVSGTNLAYLYIKSPNVVLDANGVSADDLKKNPYTNDDNNLVKGTTDVYYMGAKPHTILAPTSIVPGQQEPVLDEAKSEVTLFSQLVNGGSNDSVAGVHIINIPAFLDEANTFAAHLTGPIALPEALKDFAGVKVLYSQTKVTDTKHPPVPGDSGFVEADQVPADGWSKIQSVYIALPPLPGGTDALIPVHLTYDPATAKFTDETWLETLTYPSGSLPTVINKIKAEAATISGDVTTQFHFTDTKGKDQLIQLPDMTQHFTDTENPFPEQDQLPALSDTALAAIPKGYRLVADSAKLVVKDPTGETSDEVGFGKPLISAFTNYAVQYELEPDPDFKGKVSVVVAIADESGKIIETRKPQALDDKPVNDAYTVDPADYAPDGYEYLKLGDDSKPLSGKYQAEAQTVTLVYHKKQGGTDNGNHGNGNGGSDNGGGDQNGGSNNGSSDNNGGDNQNGGTDNNGGDNQDGGANNGTDDNSGSDNNGSDGQNGGANNGTGSGSTDEDNGGEGNDTDNPTVDPDQEPTQTLPGTQQEEVVTTPTAPTPDLSGQSNGAPERQSQGLLSPVTPAQTDSQPEADSLPQTGNRNQAGLAIIGAALVGLIGFLGFRRKAH